MVASWILSIGEDTALWWRVGALRRHRARRGQPQRRRSNRARATRSRSSSPRSTNRPGPLCAWSGARNRRHSSSVSGSNDGSSSNGAGSSSRDLARFIDPTPGMRSPLPSGESSTLTCGALRLLVATSSAATITPSGSSLTVKLPCSFMLIVRLMAEQVRAASTPTERTSPGNEFAQFVAVDHEPPRYAAGMIRLSEQDPELLGLGIERRILVERRKQIVA